MTSSPPVLLIDGDVLAYQAASASEQVVCFDGDNCFPVASLHLAVTIFEDNLRRLLRRFKTETYYVALTHPRNFRKEIYPAYKSNREGKPKPVCLSFLKEHIEREHPAYLRPGLEADDVLGILATTPNALKELGERVIVSSDKDMRTIPASFYDLKQGRIEVTTERVAVRNHLIQTLTGDPTDGYPGCPGVGKVKAEKLLTATGGDWSYHTLWPLVLKAYTKAGLNEEAALTQARRARICQRGDYDFKKKEVILWIPPAPNTTRP